ncbi:hypothetical protein BJ508DRAFT_302325 [Ascobolus immersus RN42]|uniref:Uncharacterized protein n=1 Tax=Ascobolus immersus RN42 TaxID=1160509 RepID=A0A3N4IJC4_ASCIM|nr:hypothetical protein BJ508DRAFT_302325 [Ascobolus immersus RN42]
MVMNSTLFESSASSAQALTAVTETEQVSDVGIGGVLHQSLEIVHREIARDMVMNWKFPSANRDRSSCLDVGVKKAIHQLASRWKSSTTRGYSRRERHGNEWASTVASTAVQFQTNSNDGYNCLTVIEPSGKFENRHKQVEATAYQLVGAGFYRTVATLLYRMPYIDAKMAASTVKVGIFE